MRKMLLRAIVLCICLFVVSDAIARKRSENLRTDKPFAEQIVKERTTYIISDFFDLGGQKVTIPAGCTLMFEGGCLRNGTLIGCDTKIVSDLVKIIEPSLMIEGTWNVKNLHSEWFGPKGDGSDDTAALTTFFNFPAKKKTLKKGTYGIYELQCEHLKDTEIYAYGATLQYLRTNLDKKEGRDYPVLSNYKGKKMSGDAMKGWLHIYGLTIDGNTQNFVYNPKPEIHTDITTHHTLHLILLDELILKECTFRNSFMTAVMVHVCKRSEIAQCTIINSGESVHYEPDGTWYSWEGVCVTDRIYTYDKGLQIIKCDESIVRDSYFENIGGSFASCNCKVFKCFGNKVVDNRGYAFELSGEYQDRLVDIHDNKLWRVGSAAINMTYFNLPSEGTNTVQIHNNQFQKLGYDSHRTKKTIKQFLMVYRNRKDGSEGKLNVEIKNNLFELTPEAGSGLIKCDNFLFKGNILKGYKGEKTSALFYCENDESTGAYYILNNNLELLTGAVSRVRNPKSVEVIGNTVITSQAPAIVYIQDNVREAIFKVNDNRVTGVPSLLKVLSPSENLEIKGNNSVSINRAIDRTSANIDVRCLFKNNSFSSLSESMKNIQIKD